MGAHECKCAWMTFLHLNFILMRFLNPSDLIGCGGDPLANQNPSARECAWVRVSACECVWVRVSACECA